MEDQEIKFDSFHQSYSHYGPSFHLIYMYFTVKWAEREDPYSQMLKIAVPATFI